MKNIYPFIVLLMLSLIALHNNAQNIGIGSTLFTPNYLLHIHHNSASGTMFQISNTTTGSASSDGFQFNYSGSNVSQNNMENGDISFYINSSERMRISNDSGIALVNPVDYVYTNYSGTEGFGGYGFRSWNGQMQYKHKGGAWADFPTMPSIPGNVEWWIRPTAAVYIRPISNDFIRVWDNGQTYGISYDGGGNLIGGYFRITNTTLGAAAVQGFSDVSGNQTYGYLGYNDNITVGSTTVGGAAVHGRVDDPNRTAVYGRTSGSANVAAMLGYSSVWIASYNWTDNSSAVFNPSAVYAHLNVTGTVSGNHEAIKGFSQRTTAGNVWYTIGVTGIASANTEDGYGIYGFYSGTGSSERAGGFFYSTNGGTSNYGWVQDNATNRKIIGTGSVSEIVPTENYGRVTLTCPESPEYWYIDYGSVQMVNGKAHFDLDPVLTEICVINNDNPIKVICQDNMVESNGVAVINKTSTGFDIIEKNNGAHSGEIDFQIIAKPKTNYGEGRFPQARAPYMKSDKEPIKAKAQNQPDYENVYRWPNDWEVYGYDIEEIIPIGDIIPGGPNAGKVKLGNGKYGDQVPINKNALKQE